MIYVGLAGWGDHPDLYLTARQAKDKLHTYAGYFPTVEIDSTYYAVQPQKNFEKWVEQTPTNFRFVVKAYQGMTGQHRGELPFDSVEEMFEAYRASLDPLIHHKKLEMILCQFPPWFDCRKEHVEKLRYVRRMLEDLPVAIEFRHQSWYSDRFFVQTLQFLKEQKFIHTVCDEPQAGEGSIPIVPRVTTPEAVLIRLHGRNVQGWRKATAGAPWREVRYLYDYNKEELQYWVKEVRELHKRVKDVYVIFNNNSGRHAAKNALSFLELAGITYEGLAPKQLSLFGDE